MELLTNAALSASDAIVDGIQAYGPSCFGCLSTGAFCMVSGMVTNDPRMDGNPTFYDLFCTREQAEMLLKDLQKILGEE